MTQELPRPVDLSVVVATAHPGEDLDRLLETLLPQLRHVGGELILVDGSTDGVATPAEPPAPVHVLRAPGLDVFSARALGAAQAQGWVVAFTEVHCLPGPDWCLQILDAHRAHPTRAAVTGATVNGSPKHLVDRANFIVTFADVLPPVGELERTPPPNNISLKREALAEYELTSGFIEFELMPHLTRVGHVGTASEVVVAHVQSHGWLHAVRLHFHNGRSTTALLERSRSPRTLAGRVGASLALGPRRAAAVFSAVRRRPGQLRHIAPAALWIVTLLGAHSLGELAGIAAGPGSSPAALD